MSSGSRAHPDAAWVTVVPVKARATAKSRLDPGSQARRRALAGAFAVDTVAALVAVDRVRVVVVVCGDHDLARDLSGPHVELLDEPDPAGLNPATEVGIRWSLAHHPDAGICVLPADLPALRPADVAAALHRAASSPRTVLADPEGTGTTMLTGLPGTPPRPCFGPGSLARHVADGAVALDGAGLARASRDVDTAAHLLAVRRLGVGRATRLVLDGD